jgi:hypothetical protein
LRKENIDFSEGDLRIIKTGNDHVLGFTRSNTIIFANFSEEPQLVSNRILEEVAGNGYRRIYGISNFKNQKDLVIDPLDLLVINHRVRHEA